MLYKGGTSTNILITEKMGTTAPLAIGTRGTVGSLVRREIEYFRRLELDRGETSKKPKSKNYVGISNNNTNTTTTTTSFSTSRMKAATLGSLLNINWRRKKRRSSGNSNSNSNSNSNNSTILPSMCSAVDVSESKRFGGLNYRNLKADIEP